MLKIEELAVKFGKVRILNGVSLKVQSGETVGLIGPNGSGKTTLFNAISGFVLPVSGEINFMDREITLMPPHARAELGLGRVFQNFGIFKEMSVLENVITALEGRDKSLSGIFPWSQATRKHALKAHELLSEVKLEDKASNKASSLSGGQMRLLEIMRTLAYGAELFLLDEPTAGVSPRMKEDVAKLIRRLQELNKTVLIIEHDLNFIQKFCARIVVLDQGKVVLDDTPDKVRSSPMLQEIYFGGTASPIS